MHSCPICEKSFTTRSALTGHSQTHKKIKPVEMVDCQICGSSYDSIVLRKNGQYVKLQTCSRKCGGALRGKKLNEKKRDELLQKLHGVHGDIFDYSKVEYVNAATPIIVGCPSHGFVEVSMTAHIKGKHGCPQCGLTSRNDGLAQIGRDRAVSLSLIQERIKDTHGDRYSYPYIESEFNGVFWGANKITIVCKEHGPFKQNPGEHANGSGCVRCSRWVSNKERMWLDSIGLPNDAAHRQVRFGQRTVDGFDPVTNTIYLYHGSFWHGNPKVYDPNDTNPFLKKTYGELYEKTLAIEEEYRRKGFNLVIQWEH